MCKLARLVIMYVSIICSRWTTKWQNVNDRNDIMVKNVIIIVDETTCACFTNVFLQVVALRLVKRGLNNEFIKYL